MGSKHTKGKWEVNVMQPDAIKTDADTGANVICIAPERFLAMSYYNWPNNSRLISCAPEMYDLLKEMNGGHLSFTEFDKRSKSLLNRIDNE